VEEDLALVVVAVPELAVIDLPMVVVDLPMVVVAVPERAEVEVEMVAFLDSLVLFTEVPVGMAEPQTPFAKVVASKFFTPLASGLVQNASIREWGGNNFPNPHHCNSS